MAWLNLSRNKKRTIITLVSVFVSIMLALFMRSMQIGTYNKMIEGSVKLSTGYLQVQAKDYWENKSINKLVPNSKSFLEKINNIEYVNLVVPKIESFALIAAGFHSKGIMVIGTDPEKENIMNSLKSKMIKGQYLSKSDNQILISEKLAEFLHITVSDTIVLIGQGYHGVSAAGEYRIKGIFRYPIPELNNKLIYMTTDEASAFFAAENQVTSYTIMINDPEKIDEVKLGIQSKVGENYSVLSWEEMNKKIVQVIESDNAGGIFMLGILYMIVGFGVLGTMMMMTMERKKEFAIMIAVGMQKIRIVLMLILETILLGFTGILTGSFFAFPVILYLYINPILLSGEIAESYEMFGLEPVIPFALNGEIFVTQAVTVAIIIIIAAIYPIYTIFKFNLLKAMRS